MWNKHILNIRNLCGGGRHNKKLKQANLLGYWQARWASLSSASHGIISTNTLVRHYTCCCQLCQHSPHLFQQALISVLPQSTAVHWEIGLKPPAWQKVIRRRRFYGVLLAVNLCRRVTMCLFMSSVKALCVILAKSQPDQLMTRSSCCSSHARHALIEFVHFALMRYCALDFRKF